MKLLFKSMLILIVFWMCFSPVKAQSDNKLDQEFLYAIVEIESKKDGAIGVNVIKLNVIAHPLKTQSKSKRKANKSNDISVLIKDDNGVVLDEVIYGDVFTTDFEYVNEDGEYQHYKSVVKKKVILIRKIIDKSASSLSFVQGDKLKSQSIHNFNFR